MSVVWKSLQWLCNELGTTAGKRHARPMKQSGQRKVHPTSNTQLDQWAQTAVATIHCEQQEDSARTAALATPRTLGPLPLEDGVVGVGSQAGEAKESNAAAADNGSPAPERVRVISNETAVADYGSPVSERVRAISRKRLRVQVAKEVGKETVAFASHLIPLRLAAV